MFVSRAGIWKKQLLAIAGALTIGLGAAGAANAALDVGPGESFQTNYIELPAGQLAGGQSGSIDGQQQRSPLSSNGRYLAFVSDANTLDPAADPDVTNVYRKDLQTGAVELVSRKTGAAGTVSERLSYAPSITADGSKVAFVSEARLDPADTDDFTDVYVRNLSTDTTILASPGTDEQVPQADISGNGQYVAITAVDPLVGGDLNLGSPDIYRRTLSLPVSDTTYELVSKKAVSDNAGAGGSLYPSISGDGRFVAYASAAADLVAGFVDNNTGNGTDIYVRDMTTPTNNLVSSKFDSATQGANGSVNDPQIAGTPGSVGAVKITYWGDSTNTVPAGIDNSSNYSVYLRAMSGPLSTLISQSTDEVNGNNQSAFSSVSDDGNLVTFTSNADNLGAGADGYGVFLRNITAGTTTLISADNFSALVGELAGNGAVVSWWELGGATADSDPDATGVFTRTLPGGAIKFASRPSGNAPYLLPAGLVSSSPDGKHMISADGRYVVFVSNSQRLPGNGKKLTVYRRDLKTGDLLAVSRANGASGAFAEGGRSPNISSDGTKVSFVSGSDLTPADNNLKADVYVRDITTNTTTLVSRADGANGAVGDKETDFGVISGDGKRVGFYTESSNLVTDGTFDQIYVRDLAANKTILVSRAPGVAGDPGNGDSDEFDISGDGKLVAFTSTAFNFDPADGNNDRSIYVRNLDSNALTLVSRQTGLNGDNALAQNLDPAISGDGKVVAWETGDEDVATEAGPWPAGTYQVISRVLSSGANSLVSRSGNAIANEDAGDATLDRDGSTAAFASTAENLKPGLGGDSHYAVFVRDSAAGTLSGPPQFGKADNSSQGAGYPSLSDNGQCLAYEAQGHNEISGDSSDIYSQYVHVVSGTCSDPRQDEVVEPPVVTPKPKLTQVKLTPKKFAVAKKATAKVSAKKKKAKKGTKIRFTLNVNSSVTIKIERKTKGRKVKGQCRKATKKNKAKKKCSRFVKTGKLVRKNSKAGNNTVAFSGRIGKKKLKPGKYRASLTAYNKSGKSKTVRRAFTVVKR